jgi:DNA-directed RNA polymerase subunit N (RpoN/RPB10)
MTKDFKPVNCRKCGAVIWQGISWAGFARALDTARLTIEEEIVKVIMGIKTYEAHRTLVSFEAVERSANRIKWADPAKDHVILADHLCAAFTLFATPEDAPNYWNRKQPQYLMPEEAPF